MQKVVLDNGLVVQINFLISQAYIIGAPKKYKDLLIPRSVKAFNRNYNIIKIKSYAFKSCNIESIQFSNDSKLKTIEDDAFADCNYIGSILFPSCIKKVNLNWPDLQIKKIDFLDDSILKELHLPYCFQSIESITIPSSITVINRRSFRNCKYLKSIEFCVNSQLSIIKEEAFDSSGIESISIPSNVRTIEDYAFNKCENLTFVEFSEDSKLLIIGKFAFLGCKFDSIKIPVNVTKIRKGAFYYCEKLNNIEISKDSKLKVIEEYAFANTKIKTFYIPSGVKIIENYSFYHSNELADIEISSKNQYFTKLNNSLYLSKKDLTDIQFEKIFHANPNIQKVTIPSYVKIIGTNCFSEFEFIETVKFDINSQLKIIGNYSFISSSITSIFIPSSVTEILDHTFEYCNKLSEVVFVNDSELISIGYKSFVGSSIKSIFIPSNVKIIGHKAFESSKLDSIKFSNDSILEKIGNESFSSTMLKEIKIPSTVTSIGSNAFQKCKMLKKIEFQKNSQLKESPNSFSETGIVTISLPPNITKHSDTILTFCQNLTSLEFLGDDLSFSFLIQLKCFNMLIISFPNAKKITYENLIFDCYLTEHEVFLFTNPNAGFIKKD